MKVSKGSIHLDKIDSVKRIGLPITISHDLCLGEGLVNGQLRVTGALFSCLLQNANNVAVIDTKVI